MSVFNDKEKAAENKYARDKETEFLIQAKYHKLLGTWAASKLGLENSYAEEYAKTLVATGLGKKDEEALFNKIKHDFSHKSIHLNDHEIRKSMFELLQKAKEQNA